VDLGVVSQNLRNLAHPQEIADLILATLGASVGKSLHRVEESALRREVEGDK
jgi:hypothetical protein